ncbi:hypothetical protein AX769_09970 [Frondihabitans sp. PAMC 28766]|uniref:M60 family metallopeptidase n=1 Tax=Frondihabitans sp. PAMC 28766 TaxID=1795630 RepID=UPI00078D2C10|nr:M60 family metallopeptidase [Frondihabitans sp. PAMC 28766]AMM20417.1 hypothetical protein AX769_09970 [Frondihabitans sp. PAMC 28766]
MIPKKLMCGVLATAVLAGAAVVSVPSIATAGPALASGKSLQVGGSSSVALVEATGDAARAVTAENRWFRHTDLQPTGRFVKAGQKLTVDVPAGSEGLEMAIGLYGVHSSQNAGKDVGMKTTALKPGVTQVTAAVDGMVYLENRAGATDAVVEIAGGQPVPTWVEDETTRADFDRQLEAWKTAPYVEVVSDRILVDFQASVGRPGLSGATKSVDALIDRWDTAVEVSNDTYGLTENATGRAHKHGQRMYISNPDTGAGYASATNDRITFQNDTNAAKELIEYGLAKKNHWGFYHEVGHTYQPPEMRWSGMTEVTVNVSALAVQEALGIPNRLDEEGTRQRLAKFRETPVAERDHNKIGDLFVQVLMFDQLRRSFGDGFYPKLAQEWRVEKALGEQLPSDDLGLKQHFALTTSKVADRDLTPFYEQWGIPLTADTRAELAKLPALQYEIWNYHDRATDVVENRVADYVVPVGTLTAESGVTATIGQQKADEESFRVDGLGNSDGSAGARLASSSVTALKEGTGAGTLNAILVNENGIREVLTSSIDVTTGNLLRFNGIDRNKEATTVADLALDEKSSTLRAFSRGPVAHDYFPNEEYFGVDVVAPNGRVVTGASVQGQQTAAAFAKALDGYAYQDGQYLVVRHAEPTNRLIRFADSAQQPKNTGKMQAFRIADDRLVPVAVADVPKCSGDCRPAASVEGDVVEGTSVTVTGVNFVPGETVSLTSEPGGIAGEAVVQKDGTVEVFDWLTGEVKPGTYELTLTGPSSKASATTTVTVLEKDEEVSPPGGECGVIPADAMR